MCTLQSQLLVVCRSPRHDLIGLGDCPLILLCNLGVEITGLLVLTRKYLTKDVLFISIKRHSGLLGD